MEAPSLKAFVTAAELSSFSLAAEQLLLTQPAISKRIANLEQQLQCRLFDRIGRTISLTEAGQTLLPKARNILLQIEDTRRLLTNRSGKTQGSLSLATSHHISLHRLPPVLRLYRHQYPDVALDLKFEQSEVAYEGVLSGALELAVITLSPQPHPQICSTPIWIDRLSYCCAVDHPLAQQPRLQLSDLTRHQAILPTASTFTRQLVEKRFEQQRQTLDVGMSTNNLDTIRMMVSIGLGWSLLPQTMLDSKVGALPLDSEQIQRPLGLIYHRDRTLSNAGKAFIELLRKQGDTHALAET
ncbi:MAG: DNA-binding transcriptional LysR family regulator [Motiliproteus sp.]|jgi:DNA-binding transcriptional LysR family regulator